jgi:anti-sigma factor RsiW
MMNCADATALIELRLTGELDRARTEALSAHLQACSACAFELARVKEFNERFRAEILADRVDTLPLDSRVMARIASQRALRRTWITAGISVAAVMLAGLIGYRTLFPRTAQAVYAAAARDHRYEVVDRNPRKWQTDSGSILDLVVRRGVAASIIPAFAPAGYRLAEGKLCLLNGQIFLHLVYTNGRENYSVYVGPGEEGKSLAVSAISAADVGAEHVAGFDYGTRKALVVTDQPDGAAVRLASYAASKILNN